MRLPKDFGTTEAELGRSWASVGPGIHRDSTCLEVSNYETVRQDLETRFPDHVTYFRARHWAVGWVESIYVQALETDGDEEDCTLLPYVTPAFVAWTIWRDRLEDYPIANEEDFSEREYEYAIDYLVTCEDIPPEYACQVYSELYDMGCQIFENHSPSRESILTACAIVGCPMEEEV